MRIRYLVNILPATQHNSLRRHLVRTLALRSSDLQRIRGEIVVFVSCRRETTEIRVRLFWTTKRNTVLGGLFVLGAKPNIY
jgi:hypothetical protein